MDKQGQGKVVKINVMWPFCVKCHIGIHLNASVVSDWMDVKTFSLTFKATFVTNGD